MNKLKLITVLMLLVSSAAFAQKQEVIVNASVVSSTKNGKEVKDFLPQMVVYSIDNVLHIVIKNEDDSEQLYGIMIDAKFTEYPETKDGNAYSATDFKWKGIDKVSGKSGMYDSTFLVINLAGGTKYVLIARSLTTGITYEFTAY